MCKREHRQLCTDGVDSLVELALQVVVVLAQRVMVGQFVNERARVVAVIRGVGSCRCGEVGRNALGFRGFTGRLAQSVALFGGQQ